MQSERLVIKYITTKNCFAYLSDTWLRKLETKENVIELLHNDKTYYLSCNARTCPDGTLCLGATFARSLNIEDGDEVSVSSVKDTPTLTNITVTPHSVNDREILELQMEKIQSTLLNQIRIAAKNQTIVIWVSKFSCITVTIESLEPNFRHGKLEQFTEVHVSNSVAKQSTKNTDGEASSLTTNIKNIFKNILSLNSKEVDHKTEENKRTRNQELLQSFRSKRNKPRVYRTHCLPEIDSADLNNESDLILRHPFHVFVPKIHVPTNTKFTNGSAIFKITKVSEDRQYVNTTSTNFLRKDESSTPKISSELIVELFVLDDVLGACSASVNKEYFNLNLACASVYVSTSLRTSLKLRTGSRVVLHQMEIPEEIIPTSIEIFPWKQTVSVECFENYVKKYTSYGGVLINSCAAIVFDNGDSCVIKIAPEECTFAVVDERLLKNTIIHLRNIIKEEDLFLVENSSLLLGKVSRRYLRNILAECQLSLDFTLGLRKSGNIEYDRENILICGEAGSGKTTICKILSETLQGAPYFVHTHIIDCRSLKGKKVEILQKFVTTTLLECIYYQPSVLFFDDLESITTASSNDEENTPDAMNAARIADMLVNVVSQYQESHYISIIGTCASVNRIGQKLRPARGSHFFRTVLSIPNLEKADRIDILQLMLGDKLYVPGDVNWDYYGNKTEGWMVQDLVDMAEKATFAAWKRHVREDAKESEPPIVISDGDISFALNNSTPMSLQGIQLYKDSGHVWSDIGGLAEVKKCLIEILQWPLKYPEVFKNAPIKLQNGVLLYGMPGTGKTMLAKAIANECGVNLISVKGPELLSKYIGVSEESVRNVFERARRAKPCVLFFDEFDSLAPRRGHDSTGVTDRVVNQLLTQLDGVEDREGVAVVAASSRPDMLDPALLRPGRLDKALYCPLPDQTDREEILLALCKTQSIDAAALNLKEIAELSSGFTGADLSAAITQARLAAFEDAVAAAADGKVEAEDIKVSQMHLFESVKSTHPSLSATEKMKYRSIYTRFSKGGNFTEEILKNQKATLA